MRRNSGGGVQWVLASLALVSAAVIAEAIAGASEAAGRAWPQVNGDWSNTRYSSLNKINTSDVTRLGAEWAATLDPSGTISSIVVADGKMFVTSGMQVFAVNPLSGKIVWSYHPVASPSRKGVAVGAGRVYVGLMDASLIALDEKTGKLLWRAMVGDEKWSGTALGDASGSGHGISLGRAGEMISSVPAYVDGRVIVGLANGDFGVRGRIVGLDAATGNRVWQFFVVPGPGHAGHDTWPSHSNAWKTGGGGVWMPPAVDPQLGLVYLGTGNPVPQWGGEARAGDNLFTCSVVALDIRTGRLRWYFQTTHHDLWDMDLGTPLVLFNARVHGRERRAIAIMRTDGYLFQLDRRTGRPLYQIKELPVPQSAQLKTSPTQPFPVGMEEIGPRCAQGNMVPAGFKLECYFDVFDYTEPNVMMPLLTTRAAPMAFSPKTGYLYVTASVAPYWVRSGKDPYFFQVQTAPGMKNYGLITALDPVTGKIAWQDRVPHRVEAGSGVMATAGGLVFHGAPNGQLQAYDARTGKLLWAFQTGAPVAGPVATYEVGGTQFVAVAAGSLWAFRLGGSIPPRAAPPPPPSETQFSGIILETHAVTIGTDLNDMGLTGTHQLFDPFSYSPIRADALPGSPITWINHTNLTHTIVAQDRSWTTGPIAPGQSATVVIKKPGTYTYYTKEYPWSYGQLIIGVAPVGAVSALSESLYRSNCSACHGANLSGREPAPALAGPGFLSQWRGHTVAELYTRIRGTMPLGSAGALSDKEYLEIVKLILAANQVPFNDRQLLPNVQQLSGIKIDAH